MFGEKISNRRLKIILIGIGIIILLGVIGGGYYWWGRMPDYSISQIEEPISENTETKIEKEDENEILQETQVVEINKESKSTPENQTRIEVDLCADIVCLDCQYCSEGSCINYCQKTDNSCGCDSCVNCNKLDGWVNKSSTYSCCDNNKICSCQEQEYRDYYCSANSCSYSITENKVNKVNCFACGSNQVCSNGDCIFRRIEGLATIRISGGIWENWDADLEKDGAVIDIVYLDAGGDIIANEATKKTPISADVKVYAAPDVLTTPTKLVFSAHYSEEQIILGDIYPRIRIPKEQMTVNPYTDYQYGAVEVTISTPQQGLFSDRSDFIVLYEK